MQFDWGTAIQKCKENAGAEWASTATLASINSFVENDWIKTRLLQIKDDSNIWDLNSAWIGLSKKDIGESVGKVMDYILARPIRVFLLVFLFVCSKAI